MSEMHDKLAQVQVENLVSSYQHPPYILEMELAGAMEACQREKSREILEKINQLERAKLSDSPLQSLQYSLICGCTCYTRTAIRAGVDSELAFNLSDIYIREIGKTHSVKALTALEYAMLEDFIGLIEQEKKRQISGNGTVNRIVRFIHANIHRRITLKDIAEELQLHPVYVSSLFHKETGMSVSDFIESNRILAIKKFLTETDLKMLDVAEIFAFSSAAHFSTYFKKATGQTPYKYRTDNKLHSR